MRTPCGPGGSGFVMTTFGMPVEHGRPLASEREPRIPLGKEIDPHLSVRMARPRPQVWIAESGTGRSLHHTDLQNRIKHYNLKAEVTTQVNIYKASSNCSR